MTQIKGLIHYISELEKSMDVSIIIKDFVGFLNGEIEIFNPLQQFYIHQSKYCMMIKEENHLWDQCLDGIELIQNKLNIRRQAYYTYCHAGVGEYIVPIIVARQGQEFVVGAVTVGGFYSEQWAEKKKSLMNTYQIDEAIADEFYKLSFRKKEYDLTLIEEKMAIIAEYIALVYQGIDVEEKGEIKNQFNQNYIIGHVVAYLKMHYKEEITLKQVALFCHCSPSYISHNFKKLTGKSLKSYINELRVESSKALLSQKHLSITEIAYKVGFKDGNYYSKVFSDHFNDSPLHYRKNKI